jgi:alpha-L-rhamnosidase
MAVKLRRCLALFLLAASATVAVAADDIVFERVIGPEFPGKYKHPASIAELANGDLVIAYYGGDGEYAEATAVYGMRKERGRNVWSAPKVIADTPFRSDGNAVIW